MVYAYNFIGAPVRIYNDQREIIIKEKRDYYKINNKNKTTK